MRWKSGRGWSLIVCLLGLGLLGGCSRPEAVLYLYNWSDYMSDEVVREFEKEFQCRVILDTFESNEVMYAKVRTGGGEYDIIVPTSYMAQVMWDQEMLLPIDPEKVPNLSNVDPLYLKALALDQKMEYSVPYMLGSTGMAYRKDVLGDLEESWNVLADPRLKGRMTILNDMREVIGAALKSLGYSLNSTDPEELAKATEVLAVWRTNLAKFDSEQYKSGLASGEFHLVQGYSGDILQVMAEVKEVGFFLPKEGFALGVDCLVIPKNARSPELAHAFINFLHRPEIAAKNIEFTWFYCPNKPAYDLVDEEIRNNPLVFIPEEKLIQGEVISDLGNELPRYSRIWDQMRRGK